MPVHLIVAEKNISARRIAQLLSGSGKVVTKKEGGVNTYSFDDTVVMGLRGHVVEVDFEPGYSNWRSETRTPRTLIDAGIIKKTTEKKIVSLIRKFAKKADLVTIATDFDTEGELIGKEAYEIIRAVNATVPVMRAKFSAITPQEIREAFSNPTEIDFALAAAGEARQIIDLMWGASLTRFISIAARRGGSNILSVGRVQSPTLAMIVDREKEIESFVPEKYWLLFVETEKHATVFEAQHTSGRFSDYEEAARARDNTQPPLTVTGVKEGKRVERAPPPFDTTGFIMAAARIGFSVANAMRIAEDLYMNGYISYPRTDNTVYPATLDLNQILKTLRLTSFRDDAAWVERNRRPTPTRGRKRSTDHPPIHPAGAATREKLGEERWRIYELVVRRFFATLSPDALWATVRYDYDAHGVPYATTGSRLLEPGWRRVYPYAGAKERVLPVCTLGEHLPIRGVNLEEKETEPPRRYSQSSLIKRMEDLGLGTKSTRHEVIGKLISRRYVTGAPLSPTLVGRAVIDALEHHADTITRPDMTGELEEHMEEIKERRCNRDDVVLESRGMLHQVFDALEAHETEIGEEIMDQTAEEHTLGSCPVCGSDLRIRHMGASQFIGCTGYPECRFNISLPGTMWGRAIRIDTVCPDHQLMHVRLIRKGARPWDIGCPLCNHIKSNTESLKMITGMSEGLLARLHASHIYTVSDLIKTPSDLLADTLGIRVSMAETLIQDAETVMQSLRRRSELRKFVRKHVVPRRGRSHAKIMKHLLAEGIDDISALAGADIRALKKAGLSEKEAGALITNAREICSERLLREAGIPAVSIRRYIEAGFSSPEDFSRYPPLYLSAVTGISPDTVQRHAEKVCLYLGVPVPEKVTKARIERGKAELLALDGLGEAKLASLYRAGVIDAASLKAADPCEVSVISGIPEKQIKAYIEQL